MIYFRVDSNEFIASGHLMRCMAIARELEKRGEDVVFVASDDNPKEILEKNGFYLINLHSDWTDLRTEVSKMLLLLAEETDPILFIDTYSVFGQYVNVLSMFAKVVYLGSKKADLGNLSLLINYSAKIDADFYIETYQNKFDILLGPKYTPLREEFVGFERNIDENIKRVLITTGNTDSTGIVKALLERIIKVYDDEFEVKDLVFDVVLGSMFTNKEEIKELADSVPYIVVHEKCNYMGELMRKSQIAISAGGNTMNELAAMGEAIIAFAVARDQIGDIEAFSERGACIDAGVAFESQEGMEETADCAIMSLIKLVDEKEARQALQWCALDTVGGNGTQLICDEIQSL